MYSNVGWPARGHTEPGGNGAAEIRRHPASGVVCAVAKLYTAGLSAVILALFAPLAVLTSRKVQKCLLALAVLNIPLNIAKHFFIREDAEDMGSIGGLEISVSYIALAGLYLAWLLSVASDVPQQRTRIKISLPVVFFLLFNALSLLVATDATLGLFEVWIALELSLLYLYISNRVTSREDVLFVIRLLLIGLIFEDLIMLGQVSGLLGDINSWGIRAKAQFLESSRISGTIGAPNSAASYLGMVMAVALGVILARVGRADKYLAAIALTMGTVPLIFTLSRGGWLGFIVSLATVALFASYHRRLPWKAVLGAVTVLVLLVLPFAGDIGDRLSSDDKGAAESRMPLNRIAGLMIQDHPLLGVGSNNFPLAMESYATRGFLGEFLYTVHNKYLLVWTETGIGGLIAFVCILLAILRQGSQCWKFQDPLFSPLALGCAAAVAGHMAQMFVDTFRGGPQNHLLWLFGGLVTVMNRLSAGHPGLNCVQKPRHR
jgi:putative inorganic carbon (HCO3(-)) transporter